MRKYIRHPSDIPIEFGEADLDTMEAEALNNVGYGGLSFNAHRPIKTGAILNMKISLVRPPFEARGRVAWCCRAGSCYKIGVAFLDENDVYRARMVEQICYIEQYKRDIVESEGRQISSEEAAREWIEKYAKRMPGLDGMAGH